MNERFGLFFVDLWRWDGEFVITDIRGYEPIPADQLAKFDKAQVPLSYHLPPGLLMLLAIAAALMLPRFPGTPHLVGVVVIGVASFALLFADQLAGGISMLGATVYVEFCRRRAQSD